MTKRIRPSSRWGLALLGALALGTPAMLAAQRPDTSRAKPDNTAHNKAAGLTAQQQGSDSADRRITRDIRKAVVKNSSLSGYAHNVKIITVNGTVTLRGPVRSEQEQNAIAAVAKAEPGVVRVVNQSTVKPEKPKGPSH